MNSKAIRKNRLKSETSPYLKQHENNPVEWFPWGQEAIALAKKEDKPILLSIGYSACHWCHVMAHESFEDETIAQIMNDHYVCIKVDREERPDLDQIYQPVAQMIMKGGGWPLTVFLTPDLKPYYGGTYFPPVDRQGRPGFPKLLMALSEAYQNTRDEVLDRAEKITEIIQDSDAFSGNENFSDPATLIENAFDPEEVKALLGNSLDRLLSMVDWQSGGFGDSPKFPNPMVLHFLWRMSKLEWVMEAHRKSAYDAVHLTLQKMACGGIFDQIGGGFHRYSTDDQWLVPHFEKMLYDNALLLKIYAEVILNDSDLDPSRRKLYGEVLESTVAYVEREMTSIDGLFYAAQDADTDGVEGKFFVWEQKELLDLLTPDEYSIFGMVFEVTEHGNFEEGKTILARQSLAALYATELNDHPLLKSAKEKVFQARSLRKRPSLDSKSLVSWNGLMISGLSWAALALTQLGQSANALSAKKLAQEAFKKIKERAGLTGAALTSTVQEGQGRGEGYLDDYAFLALAATDLCRIDPENAKSYLRDTQNWLNELDRNFKDQTGLGYFFTQGHHEDLIHRPKTFYDQAIPSGNSIAIALHLVLNEFQTNPVYARAEVELAILLKSATENPYGLGELLNSALLRLIGPVAVQGEFSHPGNPFLFLVSPDAVGGQTQFCHRQTCVLGDFELSVLQR